MGNPDSTIIQQKIRESFEAILSSSAIIAVYIFGSYVKSRERNSSDIDIALLLDEKSYKGDPITASAPAYLAATRVGLAIECETDITILNTASLEMAYEVITSGICLVETDREKRIAYEIALRGMYFDFKPFLEEIRSECINTL
jgi:predicted nucleotidyltransferase